MPKDIFFTVIGILAIISCVLGFMRGAVIQVFSLIGFALAFLFGPLGGNFVLRLAAEASSSPFFRENLGRYTMIMGFGTLIYAVSVYYGRKVQKKYFQKKGSLKILDRVVGAAFGLAKTLVIALFLARLFDIQ